MNEYCKTLQYLVGGTTCKTTLLLRDSSHLTLLYMSLVSVLPSWPRVYLLGLHSKDYETVPKCQAKTSMLRFLIHYLPCCSSLVVNPHIPVPHIWELKLRDSRKVLQSMTTDTAYLYSRTLPTFG